MTDHAEPGRARAWRLAALAAVTLVGLWLLWPVPLGHAPLSKDHTVHLTRAWMWAQFLAQGSLRGYSEVWFFGTPIGEVYPVLGDMLVVGLRVLGLGLLDWHQAYALAFTLVFVSQGWVMLRLARVCGLSPVAGLVAGVLVLCDAGAYREGGWIYTVDYGVWPQALANTMTYLALAEWIAACDAATVRTRTWAIVRMAAATAGALLAHQISLPVLVLTATVVLTVLGLRRRARFGHIAFVAAIGFGLGLALAAWWVLPMTGMRGWMVSYGWLWQPLQWMVDQTARGHLSQGMPAAITVIVLGGVALVAVRGSDGARALVACGVVLWVWTAEDTLWQLRLDLFSPAFAQIQWQRFLIAAKPGLLLAGGAGIGMLATWAHAAWSRRGRWRGVAAVPAAIAAAAVLWGGDAQLEIMRRAQVGTPQLELDPDDPSLRADYDAMAAHLRELWQADAAKDWRMTVVAQRNAHWYMDLPVRTGIPLYKQGFTPGDNFVHKPEADTPALLDRLGVRYVLTRKRASVRGAAVVASFGQLRLWERKQWQPQPPARTDGNATVEVLEDDPQGGIVRVRVHGSAPGERLVFDVAGYPRWSLAHDGAEVRWFETPAVGDGPDASQDERRSGALRGGKADGDDGTEPTLLAAEAGDGEWTLRYRSWRGLDVFAALLSLLAAAAAFALVWPWRGGAVPRGEAALARVHAIAAARVRPWMFGAAIAVGVVVFAVRVGSARAVERERAVGWFDAGVVVGTGVPMHAGPLKTDMLVRPAIVLQRRRIPPRDGERTPPPHPDAVVDFAGVTLGERLTGWFALDDDAAKLRGDGKHHVRIDALADGQPATTLFDARIAHQPGRVFVDAPTGALAGTRVSLRVTVTSEGHAPPQLGFDLDLGAPGP